MNHVPGRYFPEVAFLSEIGIHVGIAVREADRIRTGITTFNNMVEEHGHNSGGSAPADILRSAHSFLTHSAIVRRLLHPTGLKLGSEAKQKALAFSERLRFLLGIVDLPHIEQLYQLRHDFEHADERLHEFFADFATSGRRLHYESIRVVLTEPHDAVDSFHRWIRPDPLTLTFRSSSIAVDPVLSELHLIEGGMTSAYTQLHIPKTP